jgi:hypothetical protein
MLWLVAIAALPPLALLIALGLFRARIAPAAAVHPLPVAVFIAPLVLIAIIALLAIKLRRAGVRVEGDTLIVNTGVGNKRVALANLRARGLHVIDLHERTELKPLIKTWGTGLPGFSGGWFRLRNGEKAVCLLLDRRQVSYLRSDADNLSLLLSLAEPDTLHSLLER